MLPRENRLKKGNDFQRVFREGKSVRGNFLVIRSAKNNLGRARFAVSVSKKVSKKATVRNKIRRRLSSLAEAEAKKKEIPADILLISLPGLEKKNFLEIKEIFNNLFEKVKI